MDTPKIFIVLFVRGGGSTFLAESLNQVPNTVCLREPVVGVDFFEKNKKILHNLQLRDDKKYRTKVTNRIGECKWIGAKLKLYDQVSPSVEKLLLNEDIPIIICLRNDIVSHAVGLCRKNLSEKSVTWHKRKKINSSYISPQEFEQNLKFVLKCNKKIFDFYSKIHSSRCYCVYYEDLCYNLGGEISKIMNFISNELTDKIKIDKSFLPLKVTSHLWTKNVDNFKEIGEQINKMGLNYNQTNSSFDFLQGGDKCKIK